MLFLLVLSTTFQAYDMLYDCGHMPLHHPRNKRKKKRKEKREIKSKKIDKIR